MTTGRVRWFSPRKGYGFILRDGGEDIFVHHSVIDMEGFRTLAEGQLVEYEVHSTDKGDQARRVRVIS